MLDLSKGPMMHTTKASRRALDWLRLHDQTLPKGVVARHPLQWRAAILSVAVVQTLEKPGRRVAPRGLDKHPSGVLQ
jgi:hypothetical protein